MAGCPACGGPLVDDRERGEVVCAQCGLVVAEAAVDTGPEWRTFNKEKRVRTAPLKLVAKTDMAVKPEHGARWRRLAWFHRETLHGRERRLAKIGGELKRIRECVGLPQSVVEECVKQILEDYKREVERLREPPEPALVIKIDPVEELLREWPELGAFGTEWVRKWLGLRERLVEIAKVLRKFPWMAEVVRQRPMSILHPYMVEVYVTRDGSETCLSLNPPKAFCAQDGAVKEIKLELEFKRYEIYEEKIREVYRPKGLLAFTTAAKEYVKIL